MSFGKKQTLDQFSIGKRRRCLASTAVSSLNFVLSTIPCKEEKFNLISYYAVSQTDVHLYTLFVTNQNFP